jgi:Na+-driven multidrug efflux pump
MRWYSVNWILVSGMGTAASVLVGQYLGAESKEGASRVSRRLILAGFLIQIATTALYFWLAADMVALMDPNPLTVGPGAAFMIWVAAGFLLSTPGGLAAAAMNGAGDTIPGMVAGFVSNWAIKLPAAWALARFTSLGLDGVWLGMFISLIAEGAICLLWYRFGGWRQKVLSRDGSRPV